MTTYKDEGVILYMSDEVARWLKKAKSDANAVQMFINISDWDQACFHARDSVEKRLKAIIVNLGIKVPKKHDLTYLCDFLIENEVKISPLIRSSCDALNGLGLLAIHLSFDATEENAQTALVNFERVSQFVKQYFESSGTKEMNLF
jgi:HEPN domain-containing protein